MRWTGIQLGLAYLGNFYSVKEGEDKMQESPFIVLKYQSFETEVQNRVQIRSIRLETLRWHDCYSTVGLTVERKHDRS